ncbi:MAG: type II toxin-antitoxin system VapC family toxin [Chloroflexota bacterium]
MRSRPGLPVSPVFVDTSGYDALTDLSDSNNAPATTLLPHFAQAPVRLFTTNFILAEPHALILIRRGRLAALRALQTIEASSTTIVRVSLADERRARQIIERYDDKSFSLTDATSFAAMERLTIPTPSHLTTTLPSLD